jgi:Fe-S-cluster containining protein
MQELVALQSAVEARTRSTKDSHPWWPCQKGCDDCCRSLAAVPVLIAQEWTLLRSAIAELPEEARLGVMHRLEALCGANRPIVCPMLDVATGACLVYAARPIACRTYGFYADREGGLFCRKVEEASAAASGIIWGNQEAIESRLDAMGPRRPLTTWFAADRR